MALYFGESESNVKTVNFPDMAHSGGWNCLCSLDQEAQLVQTVASAIIRNTSGPKGADDFWSHVGLDLLMTLIHYVYNLKGNTGNLLPIERWGLGDVYCLLAEKNIQEAN